MSDHKRMRLSRKMQGLAPSAVREILKVAERAEVTSFAGGLPAPELFPTSEIAAAFAHVLANAGGRALQYGATEGSVPLRAWIAERLARRGVTSAVDRLLITSGSQQGIDLVARVLLDPGDVVLTENPTYLAALQAFAAHEALVIGVPSDNDGMKVDELEAFCVRHTPRLIYLCPDFQNPTGITLSAERRVKLVDIARRYQIPVLEDDPYGELRYRGTAPNAIAALDDDWVLRLGTFSKTLAPGLRLGWIHGPEDIIRRLAIAKQACDLHTATLAQAAAAHLLETFDFDGHVSKLCAEYGRRRDAMVKALVNTMPPGTRWTEPEGGLFLWVELPPGVRDQDVFDAAIARGVAVVPGNGFFVGAPRHGFLRLNFSNQKPEAITSGITRLAESIRGLMELGRPKTPTDRPALSRS